KIGRQHCLDNYQLVRNDRTRGSLAKTLTYLSYANTLKEEHYYLRFVKDRPLIPSYDVPYTQAFEIQTQLLFLSIQCLIPPKDMTRVAYHLLANFCNEHTVLSPPILESTVKAAISRVPRLYSDIVTDGSLLRYLWQHHQQIYLEKMLTDKYLVIVFPSKPLDQQAIGHGMESCYLQDCSESLHAIVMLPRLQFRKHHTTAILAFATSPTMEHVRAALTCLTRQLQYSYVLKFDPNWKHLSQPFLYQTYFGPNRSLYRPDGRRNAHVWDKVAALIVKHALSRNETVATGWNNPIVDTPLQIDTVPVEQNAVVDAESLIIYARVSSTDQVSYSDSLAKQVLYCLHHLPVDVTIFNRMIIVLECISSTQITWAQRTPLRTIFRQYQEKALLLTASPERMTRIPTEMNIIVSDFTSRNITWQSLNARLGDEDESWTIMDSSVTEALEEELENGVVSALRNSIWIL
ncbi:hypothetical protein BGW37DRAFT_496806, partial [Umbelopsis sp. PMI_123]